MMKDELSSDELYNEMHKILSHHEEDSDSDLHERISSCDSYSLKTISLSDLDPNEWNVYEDIVEQYLALDIDKMPPIIVHLYKDGSYSIVDGTHRVNVALKRKKTSILAYVGQKLY